MNLLDINDTTGQYPQSWYAATVPETPHRPALTGDQQADVCIVGAGFTGLSAALHLAERGYSVRLLEAQRVGFGASGRNGGQLGNGQRAEQYDIAKWVGAEDAKHLWALAEEAVELTKSLIEKHDIDCHLKPGVAHMCFNKREVQDEHDYADHLRDKYGYSSIQKLDFDQAQALCPSPAYVGGSLDMTAGHLHPLAYAQGLARAAETAGAVIHETTRVLDIVEGPKAQIKTDAGTVHADHVILACNGYLGSLNQKVAARVMPINNYIVATEPLGADAAKVLTQDVAVADSKFVVNYFRLSHDSRLLFGGGETYSYRFPQDIESLVRKPMSKIFPHLKDIRVDYAWGGTLAITMKRMPYLHRLTSNMLSASGYSGHGVGTATHAGKLMADCIAGQSEGFDTFARIPTFPFPGGSALRHPLLILATSWYALRDRIGY